MRDRDRDTEAAAIVRLSAIITMMATLFLLMAQSAGTMPISGAAHIMAPAMAATSGTDDVDGDQTAESADSAMVSVANATGSMPGCDRPADHDCAAQYCAAAPAALDTANFSDIPERFFSDHVLAALPTLSSYDAAPAHGPPRD